MTQPKLLQTHFDSPERSSSEEIKGASRKLQDHAVIAQLLEGFPGLAVILDKNRQILAYNSKAKAIFQGAEIDEVVGNRLGEVLGCAHASELQGGCGTSKHCAECGAAQTILLTRKSQRPQSSECRITTLLGGKEGSLNLRVYTSPLSIDGRLYTLLTLKDIAHEKRLQALERIFFHDVLNTAASINSIAGLIETETDAEQLKDLGCFSRLPRSSSTRSIHSEICLRPSAANWRSWWSR
jgi:hypothetical protein